MIRDGTVFQRILRGWSLAGHRPIASCADGSPPVLTNRRAGPPEVVAVAVATLMTCCTLAGALEAFPAS